MRTPAVGLELIKTTAGRIQAAGLMTLLAAGLITLLVVEE